MPNTQIVIISTEQFRDLTEAGTVIKTRSQQGLEVRLGRSGGTSVEVEQQGIAPLVLGPNEIEQLRRAPFSTDFKPYDSPYAFQISLGA